MSYIRDACFTISEGVEWLNPGTLMRVQVSGRSFFQSSGAVSLPPPMIPEERVVRAKVRIFIDSPCLYFFARSSGDWDT